MQPTPWSAMYAVQIAADLYDVDDDFVEKAKVIHDAIIEVATDATADMIVAAIPGTEVVQPPPAQVVPIQQPAPPVAAPQPGVPAQPAPPPQAPPVAQAVPAGAPPQAGPIHANSTDDELWANLVAEMQAGNGTPQNWWDNRLTKRSANAADFAHKILQKPSQKTGRMWPVGLWMKRVPAWAAPVVNAYAPPAPQ